jgi:REP element-mobilizing transposase RayT
MNRTARKRIVFDRPEHVVLFEALLSELPGRFSARVHAWALMGNHFHLLVDVPTDGLPRLMAWLTAQLARSVNQERGWDGPLFRGRYRNRVVLDDAYWRDVLAYLHLNPVRAGLVSNPDASVWTSHRFYAGLAPAPAWMTTEELLGAYGGAAIYRQTMQDIGRGDREVALTPERMWSRPDTQGAAMEPPTPTVRTLTTTEALAQIVALTGAVAEELTTIRMGRRGNPVRALAAWWLQRAAAQKREDVADLLGMSAGAAGAAAHRVRHDDGQLGIWRDALMQTWWGPMND